jgi:hypothetical protein
VVRRAWATKAEAHAMGTEANVEGRGSTGLEHVFITSATHES